MGTWGGDYRALGGSEVKVTPLRIAVQKSGRLAERSRDMLERAGLAPDWRSGRLDCQCADFPLSVMQVRDDDIPAYLADGVVDLGIIGENVLEEKLRGGLADSRIQVLSRLAFGRCRLALAVPSSEADPGLSVLSGKRIATSYPETLRRWLTAQDIKADVVMVSGSVEIGPALGLADAVCDLVSSGQTLAQNGLKVLTTVFASEAVLARSSRHLGEEGESLLQRLAARLDGVRRAQQAKYVMMNAPRDAVDAIRAVIPGLEEPTVIPLAGQDRVALHAVAAEQVFWDTLEKLKELGATGILVVPIEKIIA